MEVYYIYIIECEDDKLYTGITTDYKRRFAEHSGSKKGAKFTKIFAPKKMLLLYKTTGRSNASKLEVRIKSLNKHDKELLISDRKYFKIFFKEVLDIQMYRRCKITCKI